MITLPTYRFGDKTDGPHLLITAGVHGDEFESILAAGRLIALFSPGGTLAERLTGRLSVIPVVNESAFLRGHRCGDDNLDLARTCPGDPHGTVTQQVAAALSAEIGQADFYIDLHTGGTEFSVYPLAGYVLHSDPRVLDVQRRMARAFNLPVIWGTAANLEGRSLSVARDHNVPAIYCEYLGAASCNAEGVDAYERGSLQVMVELGLLDAACVEASPPAVEHVIEDSRPGSGHMQVCHPSPVTGCFVPAVRLGQTVHSGDCFGHVLSTDGRTRVTVDCEHTGVVLVLRTFPRVLAGQSVGVIADQSM